MQGVSVTLDPLGKHLGPLLAILDDVIQSNLPKRKPKVAKGCPGLWAQGNDHPEAPVQGKPLLPIIFPSAAHRVHCLTQALQPLSCSWTPWSCLQHAPLFLRAGSGMNSM